MDTFVFVMLAFLILTTLIMIKDARNRLAAMRRKLPGQEKEEDLSVRPPANTKHYPGRNPPPPPVYMRPAPTPPSLRAAPDPLSQGRRHEASYKNRIVKYDDITDKEVLEYHKHRADRAELIYRGICAVIGNPAKGETEDLIIRRVKVRNTFIWEVETQYVKTRGETLLHALRSANKYINEDRL